MAMDIPKNHFKAGLIEGRQQIGLWASLASPISTEIIAGSGFDWLLLDMEHSANDLRDIYSQIQVMAEGAASAVVRVPSDDPITIKRILDTGVQSLMIPNIDDADQARRAVAATRYAPRGVRGFSQAPRAARFGRVADYHAGCEAEICVIVQLESMRALDNLEAIAAVEGVDGLFIGPGDLSMSLGYLGPEPSGRGPQDRRDHRPHPANGQARRHPHRKRGPRPSLYRRGQLLHSGGVRHRPAGARLGGAGVPVPARRLI
jgi:4-hydroxy-2-oxoheptanedioate aldolase